MHCYVHKLIGEICIFSLCNVTFIWWLSKSYVLIMELLLILEIVFYCCSMMPISNISCDCEEIMLIFMFLCSVQFGCNHHNAK